MKVVMKPIDMIAAFDHEGNLQPIRYRIKQEVDSYITIKIDKILVRREEKWAGNKMLLFTCQSDFHGILKIYEIKYEIQTCKWFLFKI